MLKRSSWVNALRAFTQAGKKYKARSDARADLLYSSNRHWQRLPPLNLHVQNSVTPNFLIRNALFSEHVARIIGAAFMFRSTQTCAPPLTILALLESNTLSRASIIVSGGAHDWVDLNLKAALTIRATCSEKRA